MPAPSKLARLCVVFERAGRLIEFEHASSPERALKVGLIILARQDGLEIGDALKCVADEANARPLPPPHVKQG
jgi:hypothetical protein